MMRTGFRLWIGVLAATLGFAACTAPEAGGSKGGSQLLEAGEACSVRAECRSGLVCDPGRRICICTSDDSCQGDLKCNPFSGRCVSKVPGCTTSYDCGRGQWCDVPIRVCKVPTPYCGRCERDEECGAGNACIRLDGAATAFCGRACDTSNPCLYGTHCADGQCVPDESCDSLATCNPDTLQECTSTADCEGRDQLCEPATRRCVARQPGCVAGKACDPARLECVPSCLGDANCAQGMRCVNAICKKVQTCTTDDDCARTKVCRTAPGGAGECVPTCASTRDCPMGQLCNYENQRWACRDGCETNADCPPNTWCGPERLCASGAGVCQTSDVCAICEACEGNRCVPAYDDRVARYCAPCGTEGLDPACGPGGSCHAGACAPSCAERECAKGFFCKSIRDDAGTEVARACLPNDGICDTECR
ncbi:Dickkopf N-terminal cysteine-rich domain-containing protein [Vulgatibacter incomptus]|nr:Dickkopf N-terminal cysteine-rich domain-containing protein [Vulgatibacter incomptus]